MHVPDGVLSPEVCAAAGAVSVGAIGYSLRRLKDSLADRTVPLTGMMAALVFAGQMVNFPIGLFGVPAVSGHLIGGVLVAAMLGPWAGCLAISLVLIVQCLLFADGGLLALGANILNMAVVGAIGGYAVFSAVRRWLGGGYRATVSAVVVACWLSVMAGAALFCLELRLSLWSSAYDFSRIFTLMVSFHSAIGIGEALITGSIVSFVLAQRPDLVIGSDEATATNFGRPVIAGAVVSLAVAAFLAPFASAHPDGLEAVAERTEFAELETASLAPFLDDYEVPLGGWATSALWQKISVSLAGLLGTGAVLVLAFVLGRGLKPRTVAAGGNGADSAA